MEEQRKLICHTLVITGKVLTSQVKVLRLVLGCRAKAEGLLKGVLDESYCTQRYCRWSVRWNCQ